MPYIPEEVREQLTYRTPGNVGELTYDVYSTALEYVRIKGESFARFAEAHAALTMAAAELYRRHVGPYEDAAIRRNGDV